MVHILVKIDLPLVGQLTVKDPLASEEPTEVNCDGNRSSPLRFPHQSTARKVLLTHTSPANYFGARPVLWV